MMKKRILIIIILILVAIGIIGSIYFISYRNDSKAKSDNENSITENMVNEIANDTNIVSNEVAGNSIEESKENTTVETSNEKPEISTVKEITQTNTQKTTQTTSSPSNNNSSSPKKETVTKSTTTPNTTTQKPTSSTSQSSSSQDTKKQETTTKTEQKVERCTNNNNHSLSIGNSGKWFSSKSDAIAYYNQQTKYWGEQWENNKIDNDTYYKNCPSGYEVWDCMYCGKWTINFYYR